MINLRKYTGMHYTFKLSGHFMSGYFCGIGKIDDKYGMVFVNIKSSGSYIPENCCILVAPEHIKCTLKSDMIELRSLCRKVFELKKLESHIGPIFYPLFKIKEVELHENP
jgi:hypothetical protein